MNMHEYQHAALRTAASTPDRPELAVLALGVAGEAGEVADLVKKHIGHGHTLDREKVVKELGDVLWYIAVLANQVGATLETVAQANIEKLAKRYPEGFSSERSINRIDGEDFRPVRRATDE